MELSEQYFAKAVPSFQSVYGSMVTVIAPIENGKLQIQKGLIGDLGDMEINTEEELRIKEGKSVYQYLGKNSKYYGIQQEVDMYTADGHRMVAVTLVANDGYAAMTKEVRINWIIGSLLGLLAMIALTFWLSDRFIRPIEKSISAICGEGDRNMYCSGIAEIDSLMDFIYERTKKQQLFKEALPAEVAELFNSFAEKAKTLTATERRILQYYIDGCEIAEVAEQAFISIHTVRKHNANIYQKLGINSRDELMLYIDLFRRCGRLNELID